MHALFGKILQALKAEVVNLLKSEGTKTVSEKI